MPCRGCANRQCNCFTINSGTTTAKGNGSQHSPFTFRPNYIPFPRPFGHLYGRTDQSLNGAPYTLFEVVSPAIDQGGNMNTGNRTNLTVPTDGLYLVGASVPFDTVVAATIDEFSIRKNGSAVSTGTWVNNATIHVLVVHMSTTTLLDLNAGDTLDLFVRRASGAGSIVVDFDVSGFHPHFWAIWMGGPIL